MVGVESVWVRRWWRVCGEGGLWVCGEVGCCVCGLCVCVVFVWCVGWGLWVEEVTVVSGNI